MGDEFGEAVVEEDGDVFLDGSAFGLEDPYSCGPQFDKRAFADAAGDYVFNGPTAQGLQGIAVPFDMVEVFVRDAEHAAFIGIDEEHERRFAEVVVDLAPQPEVFMDRYADSHR